MSGRQEVVITSRQAARDLVISLVEAYNHKDADALAGLYHPDIHLWSSLGEDRQGRDSVLAHIRELFAHLPDETMSADVLVTDGATVVVEFTSRGRDGAGRSYQLMFTEVFELSDGKVIEIRTYVDPDDVAEVSLKRSDGPAGSADTGQG